MTAALNTNAWDETHRPRMAPHTSQPLRVLIADVCAVMRVGLIATIEAEPHMQVVAGAAHRHELIHLLQTTSVDVLVINVVGMGENPLTLLHQISGMYPRLGVVIFSATLEFVPELLAIGVKACVSHAEPEDQLRLAIRAARAGHCFLSPVIADYVEQYAVFSTRYRLLPRELQIIQCIAQGLKNQEIADQLHLALGTVDNYIRSSRKKTGCTTRVQLVAWYQRVYTRTCAVEAQQRVLQTRAERGVGA